jgi:hypothetical protein
VYIKNNDIYVSKYTCPAGILPPPETNVLLLDAWNLHKKDVFLLKEKQKKIIP